MKPKLLIISDSNAATVKMAIDQQLVSINAEIDYFTLSGRSAILLDEISFDETKMCSDHSAVREQIKACNGSNENIDLSHYSNILIFGFQLLSSANGKDWIAIVDDQGKYLSSAAAATTPSPLDNIEASLHYRFAQNLAKACEQLPLKLYCIAAPLPNEKHPDWRDVIGKRTSPLATYEREATQAMEALGLDFVNFPDTLLANNGYSTHGDFWIGNIKDYSHLSAEGAAVLLTHFAERAEHS